MAKNYKTKQRNLILQTMQNLPQKHTTAEALVMLLREKGEEIGLATVYRNLDKLVQEGQVLKYTLPGGSSACYQYTGGGCKAAPLHFHLMCTHCGQVQHLECPAIEKLAQHFFNEHGFEIDEHNTVFYGACKNCATTLGL